MKRFNQCFAALSATFFVLAGCSGGNPFEETTDPDEEAVVPESISFDLDSVTYNSSADTLTVRGIGVDNTPYEAVYTRAAALDRGGYQAYTSQSSPITRHSTAYYKTEGSTRASVVVTGGQFEHYFGGARYARSGSFDAPNVSDQNRIISYGGNYVGLLNVGGDGGDLKTPAAGTDPSVLPVQAAEVTGKVLVNADFTQNIVEGTVYNREITDMPSVEMRDLALAPGALDPDNGFFSGNVTIDTQNKGEYGGVFGGVNSSSVAGGLHVSDHIDEFDDEEEFGIFVLPKCGTDGDDAVCDQPGT